MIEMFIIAMIVSSVTLRVAGNVAVDGLFAARGKESPRYTRAKARRTPGAATRYWSEVWDDTWTGWSAKRAARKAGQPSTPRARGAATLFWAGWWQDRKRAARRRWDEGWTVLDEKRRTKATRPRPGQQTVPGTVVPNAQDERQAEPPVRSWIWRRVGWKCRICGSTQGVAEISFGEGFKRFNTRLRYCPKHMADYGPGGTKIDYGPESPWAPGQDGAQDEDEDRPGPEPRVVPTEGGRTDLRFGEDEDDPTGVRSCPECGGTVLVDGEICPSCRDRQKQRSQHWDGQDEPESVPDYVPDYGPDQDIDPSPATPPTEGPTTMTTTIPTGEVVSLESGIRFFEASADACREQVIRTEQTLAALDGFDVSGPARAEAASAMEQFSAAAESSRRVAEELKKHRVVAEAIDAVQGAGQREFYTASR